MLAEEAPPTGFHTRGPAYDMPLSCTAELWPCPGGDIVVLHAAGEIDMLTDPVLRAALHAALDGSLDQTTRHLVVDLAGVTFCCARGFALLADTARTAAATGAGYAVSGLPPALQRFAQILWTEPTPFRRYSSAAMAVTAIRADHVTDHRRPPRGTLSRHCG